MTGYDFKSYAYILDISLETVPLSTQSKLDYIVNKEWVSPGNETFDLAMGRGRKNNVTAIHLKRCYQKVLLNFQWNTFNATWFVASQDSEGLTRLWKH